MANRDKPTQTDADREMVLSFLDRFQTCFPAICLEDEGADNMVKVQPAIRIKVRGGQLADPKPQTLPVGWPSWGNIVIQGKLEKGDEVIVECMDRNWRGWLLQGGQVDPTAPGGHQAGYALVRPYQLSASKRPGATDVVRIGRKDGTATITLTFDGPGKVTIQAPEVELGSALTPKRPIARDTDTVGPAAALVTWANAIAASPAAVPNPWVAGVGPPVGTISATSTEVKST